MSKNKLNSAQEGEGKIVSVNDKSPKDMIKYLDEKDYNVIQNNILLYVEYVEPVDEMPDQLIGTETEEDASGLLDNHMFTVVRVGNNCIDIKPGYQVQIHPKYLATSLLEVPIDGYKFALGSEGIVSIFKKA